MQTNRHGWVPVWVLGFVVVVGAESPARALSCASPQSSFVHPAVGATNVAVNTIVILGNVEVDAYWTDARMVDAEGADVVVTATVHGTRFGVVFLLDPESDLEPNTRYFVVVGDREATDFVTGGARDDVRPSAPVVVNSRVDRTSFFSLSAGGIGPGTAEAAVTIESDDDRAFLFAVQDPIDRLADPTTGNAVGLFDSDVLVLVSAQCVGTLEIGYFGTQDQFFVYAVDDAGNLSEGGTEVNLVAPLPFTSCSCTSGVFDRKRDWSVRSSVVGFLGFVLLFRRRTKSIAHRD